MASAKQLSKWVLTKLPTWSPGTQLPVDRELAKRFGISVMTVRRTLVNLCRNGSLVRIKGKGTFVPTLEPVDPAPVVSSPSWQRLVNHFVEAIREGEFKRGAELPSHKQTQALFGVAPATVGRAYGELESLGHVLRIGKRCLISGPNRLPHFPERPRVLLLGHSEQEAERLFTTDFMAPTLQKMESELLSCGFSLSFGLFRNLPEMVQTWSRAGFPYHGIILTGKRLSRMHGDEFDEIFPKLQRAWRQDRGEFQPRVLVLTTNFHRRTSGIRFFSTSHTTTVMCRALAQVIAEKRPGRVHVIFQTTSSLYHLADVLRLFPEIDHVCPNTDIRYWVLIPPEPQKAAAIREQLEGQLSSPALQSRLSKYREVTTTEFRPKVSITSSLKAIVDQLGKSEVVVCRSDKTAVDLMEICRERGIVIPEQLGVISLENSPTCLHRGLTACVRDWETNGHLMAHALIGDFPVALTRRGFIAARARVMQRGTT